MSRNLWAELRLAIAAEVAKLVGHSGGHIEQVLEAPAKPGFGDFALPCFEFAKQMKKTPVEIALEIAGSLQIAHVDAKATGPYVNFYIRWPDVAASLLAEIDPEYGTNKGTRNNAVVEFSSPNPAHPFHMGTVRSTIIGESVSRILESQGWKVHRLNIVNDLGKQAATALTGYLKYAKGKEPEGKADVWIGKMYYDISKEAAEKKEIEDEIKDVLKRCEKKEKGYFDVGQKLFKWCIEGFAEDWKTFGIKFDEIAWESKYTAKSKALVEDLKKRELAFESEGAVILNLEPHGLPSTVIRRSDGTSLYLTRDVPFAIERYEKHNPELNLYVVDESQRNHFKQLFKTLDLIGRKDVAGVSKHLAYSIVMLEGKKMSARKGILVLWDELLKEGTDKAAEAVRQRWPELAAEEVAERAQQIALAAIVYYILKYDPEKPVNFMWKPALAFEGDTGPYLQYTHTRCAAILRKASMKGAIKKFDGGMLKDDIEKRLLSLLAQYPSVLAKAAQDLRPHYVANYLYSLATAFSSFYEALPVLRAEKAEREARLKLVESVRVVLAGGMQLLGIAAPERM